MARRSKRSGINFSSNSARALPRGGSAARSGRRRKVRSGPVNSGMPAARRNSPRALPHKRASKQVAGLRNNTHNLKTTSYARGTHMPTVRGLKVGGGKKRIRGGLKVF